MNKSVFLCIYLIVILLTANPSHAQKDMQYTIGAWITNPDRSALFKKQDEMIQFSERSRGGGSIIIIDERQGFQSIDGFGFALTGGSAELLMKMDKESRTSILKEIFGTDGSNIGVSYLRLSIGSSDLNSFTFSYDDLAEGETDFELKKFSLSQDLKDVVPVMKEILEINPSVKILGSPWSAPIWMKTNNNIRGGQLNKECYGVYALYFVKYVQAMKDQGINIDAVTIQNEPLNSKNTPSMYWFENDQSDFIKNHLGPSFEKYGIKTKIILFDHNLDRPDYPLYLLRDPDVSRYADGSGFHHYAGDFEAMTLVHIARPDKNLYFTEQMVVEQPGSMEIAIVSQVKRLVLGTMLNWSRNLILWNLAADPLNDPHTDNGGCSMCQGAITIDGNNVSRNIAYYVIAHASKFVRPGSVRIASTNRGDMSVSMFEDEQRPGVFRTAYTQNADVLPNVAFSTPEGRIVLIVVNDTWNVNSFRIQYKGRYATIRLNPGATGTYVWQQ